MRRHRYTRGSYRAGNVKKTRKMILARLLFTVVCALLTFLLTVLLGRYLLAKADSSKNEASGEESTVAESTAPSYSLENGIPVSDPEAYLREVCAADIDITSADADTLRDMISSLSAVYNAVSIRVSGEDGRLVYASPALMSYIRLDPSRADNGITVEASSELTQDDPKEDGEDGEDGEDREPVKDSTVTFQKECDVLENLKTVIQAAHERSLYVVVTFSADGEALSDNVEAAQRGELDALLAGELVSFGCDELLITELFDGDAQLPAETLEKIVGYLARLREHTGQARLGVNLSDGVYLVPQNASMIKTLSKYADFLSISIDTEAEDAEHAYSSVYENCYSLKGNFSVYNLRALMLSDDEQLSSAMYAALGELSARSFQFTCYVAEPSYSVGTDDTQPADSESGAVNENASRSEDYENAEDAE